jgi:hypothetical protein
MPKSSVLVDEQQQVAEVGNPSIVWRLSSAVIFLSLWSFFMVIIFGIVMLTNIDSCRSRVEKLMTQSLHRHVTLGHLALTLGLNGIAINTTKMSISEPDGGTFLKTGPSEIGIALWPLLSGHLKIRHLDFKEPELWAVRTGKGTWNFSDLMQTAIDVTFLQSTDGTVHIVDRSASTTDSFPPLELQDVDAKIERLSKHFRKPNFLSFTLSKPKLTSRFELYGLLSGHTPDWRDSDCKLKISAANIDIAEIESAQSVLNVDLSPVLLPLHAHAVHGVFNLVTSVEGTLNDKFQAQVLVHARPFSFASEQFGSVKTPDLDAHLDLQGDQNNLVWQNTTIALPSANAHIRTEGTIQHWRNNNDSTYDGTFVGMFDNLTNLMSEVTLIDPQHRTKELHLDQLQGRAMVDAHFSTKPKATVTDLRTRLTLTDVLVKGLLDALPSEAAAAFCTLNLNDQSVFSGDIDLDGIDKMKFENCTLANGTTKYKISGMADVSENTGKFNVSCKDFPLSDISAGMKNSGSLTKRLLGSFRTSPDKSLGFGGKADFSCIFEQASSQTRLTAEANLNQARVVTTNPPLSFEQIAGKLDLRPDELVFNNVAGLIGQGHLSVNGRLPAQANGKLDLELKATHLNVENLGALLDLANVDLPLLTKHELTGSARELKINLTGTKARPIVSFVATPEKLFYRAAGLEAPLQAVAGTVLYENDDLTLHDVTFQMATGDVLANLVIKNLSGASTCDRMKLKTVGLDIKEADMYLTSSLSPPAVRKLYGDMKHAHQITFTHGRIQTDITYRGESDRADFEGQLSLANVALKVGKKDLPVDRLVGTLSFLEDGIKLDDLTGTILSSAFTLDATFPKQHRVPRPVRLDLKAQLNPADIDNIVATVSQQSGLLTPELSARGPIALRAKCEGQNQASTVLLTVFSAKESALALKLPFGVFHQPTGQPLFFEGTLKSAEHTFAISDSHLTVGQDTLLLKGLFRQDKPNSYELAVKSPKFVSVKSLDQMLEPALFDAAVDGRIKGAMTVYGVTANPRLKGSVVFEKLALPEFDLTDLSGEFTAYESKAGSSADSAGKLKLNNIHTAKLKITDFTAELEWFWPNQKMRQPSVKISECHGSLADGELYGNGLLQSSTHNFSFHTYLSKASAARLFEELTGLKGELTGVLDAEVDVSSVGASGQEFGGNMEGQGTLTVRNGSVSRFGRLQAKLNQVNLLHQGLFGFNLNNLLQSVVPVRTGDFKSLTAAWHLAEGKLAIEELRYDGDDMRLWAAGEANLPLRTIELEIAGQIPRVTSSVLSGTVGGLSKGITVQKMMDTLSLHKLETLPALPLLGDFASARPRVFTFKILAPYDQPKTLSLSIEKSFHWLPSKPNATAHPVFGPAYN